MVLVMYRWILVYWKDKPIYKLSKKYEIIYPSIYFLKIKFIENQISHSVNSSFRHALPPSQLPKRTVHYLEMTGLVVGLQRIYFVQNFVSNAVEKFFVVHESSLEFHDESLNFGHNFDVGDRNWFMISKVYRKPIR